MSASNFIFTKQMVDQLASRVNADVPAGKIVRLAISKIFDVVGALAEDTEKLRNDRHLSQAGIRSKSSEALQKRLVAFNDHSAPVGRARIEFDKRYATLQHNLTKQPTDVIQFSKQKEIRQNMLGMKEAERFPFALAHIDNKLVGEAILAAPYPGAIGLSPDQFKRFRELFAERHYANEVAEVEATRNVAEEGYAALQVAMMKLQSASGLDKAAFQLIAKKRKFIDPSSLTSEEFITARAERQQRFDAWVAEEPWAKKAYADDPDEFLWPSFEDHTPKDIWKEYGLEDPVSPAA
jgi:hypothetical protein